MRSLVKGKKKRSRCVNTARAATNYAMLFIATPFARAFFYYRARYPQMRFFSRGYVTVGSYCWWRCSRGDVSLSRVQTEEGLKLFLSAAAYVFNTVFFACIKVCFMEPEWRSRLSDGGLLAFFIARALKTNGASRLFGTIGKIHSGFSSLI